MGNPVDELFAHPEMEKRAAPGAAPGKMRKAWDTFSGSTFGKGMIGATSMGAAALAMSTTDQIVSSAFQALKGRFTKQRDYKNMLEANPTLAQEDARQVQMVFNSLRTLSPTMAADPLISGSFIRNTLEMSPETGTAIAPQTAKMLAETERNVAQSGPSKSPMREAWVNAGMKGMEMAMKDRPSYSAGPSGVQAQGLSSPEAAGDFMDAHHMNMRAERIPGTLHDMDDPAGQYQARYQGSPGRVPHEVR